MCIVIDTNVLNEVFDPKNINHLDFKPVSDWIIEGKGKVIYGGSKYLDEIGYKYLKFFKLLNDANKACLIKNDIIDSKTNEVSKIIQHVNFDDQHLVSLLIVSGCKLIASNDKRAYPFFRHINFFSPAIKKPKIYSGKRNMSLLCDKNIADCCKPTGKTTNAQLKQIKLP